MKHQYTVEIVLGSRAFHSVREIKIYKYIPNRRTIIVRDWEWIRRGGVPDIVEISGDVKTVKKQNNGDMKIRHRV